MTRRSSSAYRSFGWALGMAFQINDDLLGIWGDEQATGKDAVGYRGAQADPAVAARARARDRADRAELRAILHGPPPSAEGVAAARAILERAGSRQFTRGRAAHYREEAMLHLSRSGVVDGAAMERLQRIVGSVIAA